MFNVRNFARVDFLEPSSTRALTGVTVRGLGVALTPGVHSQVLGHLLCIINSQGLWIYTLFLNVVNNNNNNIIWGGSVLTGEEPPPHSGELKHALSQAGGPTQSQLSRPMSSGHHISMEHRLRRKQ